MTHLDWGIKETLVGYVTGMADGEVATEDGAGAVGRSFRFPLVRRDGDVLSFSGRVVMTGHGGLLNVVIGDPAIEHGTDGWTLTIADPDVPDDRLVFATLEGIEESDAGLTVASAALTEPGADLFFGPYTRGTPLDAPTVVG
ncbi:HtaA domain-containing protein [Labedella phragmitis]|uniref:HtaA domain-containing protein n=1 Tax=Labedella phragmitis TaxID=2498849 RepID=UPI00140739EB|nr:HtaA domain-containing protein [Labedella phragmitis]